MQNNNAGMRSVSTSKQPHRFFERYLNNDLGQLARELEVRYGMIEHKEIDGITDVTNADLWRSSNSISTMKWREYNVFQFHIPGVRKLYDAISEMVQEACDYYEIDFKAQQFMIQGWFNINHAHNGKLDWHEHGPDGAPNFHGYYCVSAEPSETHYITTNQEYKVNVNKNNRAVLSEMGHPHAMGDWDWDGPRITVAYDVTPLSFIMQNAVGQEQHWTPLN